MLLVLLPQKFLDVEWLALASIERASSFVDLGAELTEPLEVRRQPSPDLFLVGIGQVGDFSDR